MSSMVSPSYFTMKCDNLCLSKDSATAASRIALSREALTVASSRSAREYSHASIALSNSSRR